jgi:hypothetical protein
MVEVAALLGCGASTVRRALIRLSVASRRRGPQPAVHLHPPTPRAWTPELAYAVGLMASDGNLGRVHGRLALCSNDTEMLENARRCLDIRAPVRPYGKGCHHIQWTNHDLYGWLLEVGLSPAKSLTIGPLRVPEEYFRDFFRGCIDGDGSIVVYTDRYHASKNARYIYQRLYVVLVSASLAFLDWTRTTIEHLLGVSGSIALEPRPGRRPLGRLRHAKRESLRVLRWIYYSPDVVCLARKRATADTFISSRGRDTLATGGVVERKTRGPQKPLPVRV